MTSTPASLPLSLLTGLCQGIKSHTRPIIDMSITLSSLFAFLGTWLVLFPKVTCNNRNATTRQELDEQKLQTMKNNLCIGVFDE